MARALRPEQRVQLLGVESTEISGESTVKPYYEHAGITIYLGDCREVLPQLSVWPDCVITDPVWPNAKPELAGAGDPLSLFREAAALFPREARRIVVHLGQTSDPRFLCAIPADWPYMRTCWLAFHRPIRMGRILYGGDVAYIFGTAPKSRKGGRVLSGQTAAKYLGRVDDHPCPRTAEHLDWLLRFYADGLVLDPFCGRGTTLSAAIKAKYPAIGIEIEEKYCEIAAKRLSQEVLQFTEAQP
jgi:site-specific DNA-methyltransferase (adenine-specific)